LEEIMGDGATALSQRDTARASQAHAGDGAKPQAQTNAPEAKATPGQAFQDIGALGGVAADQARVSVKVSLTEVQSWFFEHRDASSVLAALKGSAFTDSQKRELLDVALSNFSHLAFDQINALAELVRVDPYVMPDVRQLIAGALLKRVVDPAASGDNSATQARAFALEFVWAMKDRPSEMAGLIATLNPKEAHGFVRALGREQVDPRLTVGSQDQPWPDDRLNNPKLLSQARDQVLAGLAGLKGANHSGTVDWIVAGIANQIEPSDLLSKDNDNQPAAPELAHHLAAALAMNPENPPAETLDAALATPAGIFVLCEGPPLWRAAALVALKTQPALAQRLQDYGADPKLNRELADAVAAKLVTMLRGGTDKLREADRFAIERVSVALQTASGHEFLFGPAMGDALRLLVDDFSGKSAHEVQKIFEGSGDAWQKPVIAEAHAFKVIGSTVAPDLSGLSKTGRKNLIGYWMDKAPVVFPEVIEKAAEALKKGDIPPFINEEDCFQFSDDELDALASAVSLNVETVILFSGQPQPLQLLHGVYADGSEFYIDGQNHVFQGDFQNFLDENHLPEGTVVGSEGSAKTPVARFGHKAITAGFRTVQTAAILATLLASDGTDIPLLLRFLNFAAGLYFTAEATSEAIWLKTHGVGPNESLLSAYIGVAANAMGAFSEVGGLAADIFLSAKSAWIAKFVLHGASAGANFVAEVDKWASFAKSGQTSPEDILGSAIYLWMTLHGTRQMVNAYEKYTSSEKLGAVNSAIRQRWSGDCRGRARIGQKSVAA
jgi:hypothetical protein